MSVISIDINNTVQVMFSSNSLPVFDKVRFPFYRTAIVFQLTLFDIS